MKKKLKLFLILTAILIGVVLLYSAYTKQRAIEMKSPDFQCRTNFDCRQWAKVNNAHPGIMCIGQYVCGERYMCTFRCGVQ